MTALSSIADTHGVRMGESMSTIRVHTTTTSTPEQFVAALTDFGPGRAELFPNSADDQLIVHHQGPTDADVTEGSHGIWERLHYDWSGPKSCRLDHYGFQRVGWPLRPRLHPHPPSGHRTDIDVVIVREGKNFASRLLAMVVGVVGRPIVRRQLDRTSLPSNLAVTAHTNSTRRPTAYRR